MIGFYDSNFKRRKELRRRKHTSIAFFAASMLCFLLAVLPIPSPFGANMGNSIALTCFSAFLSLAMVEGLEYIHSCQDVLEDAWRRTFHLYDYASKAHWRKSTPFYFSDIDQIAALIKEVFHKPLPFSKYPNSTKAIDEYCTIRAQHDKTFSSYAQKHQREEVREEVARWVDSTKDPISHYWTLKQQASSMVDMKDDLNDLPFPLKKVTGNFLMIVSIAEKIIDDTALTLDNHKKDLSDRGWGAEWNDYRGLKQCEATFGERVERIFNGVSYTGDVYQQEIYFYIDKLLKTHLSNKPEDAEAKTPWGDSVIPSSEEFFFIN